MHRRGFLTNSLAATLAIGGGAHAASWPLGYAQTQWGPLPVRRAYVQHPTIVRQECSQWCWAASIAMIFDSQGHPIDQKKIVERTFGGLACAPAGSNLTMARALSTNWVDD